MKTNKVLSSLMAVFAGILYLIPSHALAAAFGVSPPWIENSNLKPGSNFVYVINLSSNDLSEDMQVKYEIFGAPEIAKWLTIQNQDKLIMPKGQNILPMAVSVVIPADAKIGKYSGNLRLTLAPQNGNTDNIAVLLGGNIAINLVVTDRDVTDYWIQSINVEPIAEGAPIRLTMAVKNLGNTTLANVQTKIAVQDMKTAETIINSSTDQLNLPVSPQAMANAELSIPAPDLKAGNYWLDVDAYKNGKSVYKNRILLTVNPPTANNVLKTDVQVGEPGQFKPSAPAEYVKSSTPSVDVKTSVKVRAPLTNQLIAVVIGLMIVLTGLVAKIYMYLKKRR